MVTGKFEWLSVWYLVPILGLLFSILFFNDIVMYVVSFVVFVLCGFSILFCLSYGYGNVKEKFKKWFRF
jgi:hypothetical protein